MTSPSKTWKDEAIAFVILAIAIVFLMRSWKFFAASQAEKAPRLQTYTPRASAHEETMAQRARDIDYDPPMGLGYMMMGTANAFGRGVIIMNQDVNGTTRVFYR